MARFKIGQKVVAVRTSLGNNIIKGNIYTIEGFSCCSKCRSQTVLLVGLNTICDSICTPSRGGCGNTDHNVRKNYVEKIFAPLTNTADAIEYKMKVSIPELIEIKEVQLQ